MQTLAMATPLVGALQVAIGRDHVCTLTAGGTIQCWGSKSKGELGNGTETAPQNVVLLWAWDSVAARWYFYSSNLDAAGGLGSVKAYANSRGLLHFEDFGKNLGIGTGFWVNVPNGLP